MTLPAEATEETRTAHMGDVATRLTTRMATATVLRVYAAEAMMCEEMSRRKARAMAGRS